MRMCSIPKLLKLWKPSKSPGENLEVGYGKRHKANEIGHNLHCG
jgi:hypothetical protein